MRAVLLRSLLVIGAGALVLAGVLYVASTVDARPPTVLEVGLTQPLPDETDRALITTSVEITFSEPVDLDGARDAIALDPSVEGSLAQAGSTLIFTPSEPLELETEYVLTVGPGIVDESGNEMTELPEPYRFATAGRPSLAASDPADGATDVPLEAVIALTFTGLMDTASVEEALELEPELDYEIRWAGERLEIDPLEPLDPRSEYRVRIADTATDIAGVAIADPVSVAFTTVPSGLRAARLVPADGSEGISPHTPVAIVFDRPIDPDSLAPEALSLTPSVGGTVELIALPDDVDASRLLRFTPSAPLPANTTFEVRLSADVRTSTGGGLAEPVTWSFTTGAPAATLSNQVLFISDRGGVANVWAMNPDGTGQHQVSAELTPVLDYAAAPDGSSVVVGDGRNLVHVLADGSGRRVLTEAAHIEFDPTYAPDGSRVAYARADASTGQGLGLWEWEVGGGGPTEVELPADTDGESVTPSPGDPDDPLPLRAPSYSPGGEALAFVDLTGAIGILESQDERLTRVEAVAAGTPVWDADGAALLVPLGEEPAAAAFEAPVAPFEPVRPVDVGLVRPGGDAIEGTGFDEVIHVVGGPDGLIGWVDGDGRAHVAEGLAEGGTIPEELEELRVSEIAFGPVDDIVLLVFGGEQASGRRIDRVDLVSGERTELTRNGWQVRWLP